MLREEENKITVNKILEMIYWLYQKELKSGYMTKDKLLSSFGKICKKRSLLRKNEEPNLFNY